MRIDANPEPKLLRMPGHADDVDSAFELRRSKCSRWHARFMLHEADRTVTCKECGIPIDPWEALDRIARAWTQMTENRSRVRRQLEELCRQRDALQNQIKNLKATLRRWEAKLPTSKPPAPKHP